MVVIRGYSVSAFPDSLFFGADRNSNTREMRLDVTLGVMTTLKEKEQ